MSASTAKRRLCDLPPGGTGVIAEIALSQDTALKLMQIGLWPGEEVTLLRRAPLGGPIEIELMGYRLAIRRSDAAQIYLQ